MDIGSKSGKVCLELSRGVMGWSSVVCKEREQKVKAARSWKAKAQHVLFSNKKSKPSIVSENCF